MKQQHRHIAASEIWPGAYDFSKTTKLPKRFLIPISDEEWKKMGPLYRDGVANGDGTNRSRCPKCGSYVFVIPKLGERCGKKLCGKCDGTRQQDYSLRWTGGTPYKGYANYKSETLQRKDNGRKKLSTKAEKKQKTNHRSNNTNSKKHKQHRGIR